MAKCTEREHLAIEAARREYGATYASEAEAEAAMRAAGYLPAPDGWGSYVPRDCPSGVSGDGAVALVTVICSPEPAPVGRPRVLCRVIERHPYRGGLTDDRLAELAAR